MFIEQIIEFIWWGPGPQVVQVLLKMIIFMKKQKSTWQIFEWIIK